MDAVLDPGEESWLSKPCRDGRSRRISSRRLRGSTRRSADGNGDGASNAAREHVREAMG